MGLLAGLLGLFAANKARQQAKGDARRKFLDLRKAAELGGFNPLTALQATGGAGFGAYPSSAPPLASIELITGAVDGWTKGTSKYAQANAHKGLARDLDALDKDRNRPALSGFAPDLVGSGPSPLGKKPQRAYVRGGAIHGGENAGPLSLGTVPVPDRFLDRASGLYVGGDYWPGAPGWSDGQAVEDNYGEIGSAVYGLAKLGADLAYNTPVIGGYARSPEGIARARSAANAQAGVQSQLDWLDEFGAKAAGRKSAHRDYRTVRHAGPLSLFH